jgi:uncharacterized protein
MMNPPRVVLDTNVLVSALLFHAGSLSWLRHAWQSEAIRPLASHNTTTELLRVLSYPKFSLMAAERESLLGDYLPWCEAVIVPGRTRIPDCRDPFDRPFLALAIAAKADALVTGDKDLLALTHEFVVPIFTPKAFRKWLPEQAEP